MSSSTDYGFGETSGDVCTWRRKRAHNGARTKFSQRNNIAAGLIEQRYLN